MMDPGKMDYLVVFEKPMKVPDGHGGRTDGWGDPVTADASFRFLRGGETVQASRLSGRQPVVVTVYDNSQTRAVRPSWRMRDARSGEIYNVRSGPVPTDDRQYLEFTAEGGVAV
ncbi:head-tail adaptor protein [Shinella sp. BYT-45]|uniref:head-tail adaptor protein n=1 Tax=Shinella sp. BYT-45 TaxID=3377377 RepID=UPI00398139EA